MENFEPNLTQEVVQEKKTDVLGLISMIAGIVGLVTCTPVFSIGAFVLALISKSKRGALEGKAKAGFILGIIGFIVGIIFTVAFAGIYVALMEELMSGLY